jgi:hypothetical protein
MLIKRRCRRQPRGLSLAECLMLMVVMAITGAGTGTVLSSIAKIPTQTNTNFQEGTSLVSKMEQVRAANFDALPVGTAVSPYTDNGVYVDIALADPSGGATPNANWKKITVRLANGRQLQMMVCKP